MPQNPTRLESAQPIVGEDGTMAQAFRTWTLQVTRSLVMVGALPGRTPEGVIEAPQYSLYVDETVPLVPVTYRKMLPKLLGDRKKGWAVV